MKTISVVFTGNNRASVSSIYFLLDTLINCFIFQKFHNPVEVWNATVQVVLIRVLEQQLCQRSPVLYTWTFLTHFST